MVFQKKIENKLKNLSQAPRIDRDEENKNLFNKTVQTIETKNISKNVDDINSCAKENLSSLSSFKLISFKKHKLVESKVSDEANSAELASKLWILSEEICGSFGFVTFNI